MAVLFSEKWVQFGWTFSPIPPSLWGRKREIEAEAKRRGINGDTPPAVVDREIRDICKEMIEKVA